MAFYPGTTLLLQWQIRVNGAPHTPALTRCIVTAPLPASTETTYDSTANPTVLTFPRAGEAQLSLAVPRLQTSVGTWHYRWEIPSLDSGGAPVLDGDGNPVYLASEEGAFQVEPSGVPLP